MVARTSPSSPLTVGIHEYLIEEDEMGDSTAQSNLLDYLVAVLRWLYRAEGPFVARNLTCYHPAIRNSQQMISPDIAVFLGIPLTQEQRWALTSWDMRRAGVPASGSACPPVMFEVSSEGTWQTDINPDPRDKPQLYGAMGVREYFAYDPNRRRAWRGRSERLLGWRYDGQGRPSALTPDARGWLWSDELQSWLVPDGALLHLHDAEGHLRLTEAAAMAAQAREAQTRAETEHRARAAAEAARREAEAARREAEAQAERERRARQDAESARAEAEAARAEAEAARADEARRRAALEEELRRLRQGRDLEA